MAFTSIPLEHTVDPSLVAFVQRHVEPILRDVRLMLEFPAETNGPGFNLTAATNLCTTIGGLARVFRNDLVGDGDSFRAIAEIYATKVDPASAIPDAKEFAKELYKTFRCNLVHSLGLVMKPDPVTKRWKVDPPPIQPKVVKAGRLEEPRILVLEQPGAWPTVLAPTVYTSPTTGARLLNVEGLYCGIRRLVTHLAEDPTLAPGAVAVLATWYGGGGSPGPAPGSGFSGTSAAVSHTAGPARVGFVPWLTTPPPPSAFRRFLAWLREWVRR